MKWFFDNIIFWVSTITFTLAILANLISWLYYKKIGGRKEKAAKMWLVSSIMTAIIWMGLVVVIPPSFSWLLHFSDCGPRTSNLQQFSECMQQPSASDWMRKQ